MITKGIFMSFYFLNCTSISSFPSIFLCIQNSFAKSWKKPSAACTHIQTTDDFYGTFTLSLQAFQQVQLLKILQEDIKLIPPQEQQIPCPS